MFRELLVELLPPPRPVIGHIKPRWFVLEVDVGAWPKLQLLPTVQQTNRDPNHVRLEKIPHTYCRATSLAEVAFSNIAGCPYFWFLSPGDTALVEICERKKGAAGLTLACNAVAPRYAESFAIGFEADATTRTLS